MDNKSTLTRILTIGCIFSICNLAYPQDNKTESHRTLIPSCIGIPNYAQNADIQNISKSRTDENNVLVSEDFSKFVTGTEDAPDLDNVLCNYYNGNLQPYIDNSMTSAPGWSGTQVYSAGGTAAIYSANQMYAGCINTPLGDYSGKLTIKFRAKPMENILSEIEIRAMVNGIANPIQAEGENTFALHTFSKDSEKEWKWITAEMTNMSADNDGFIQIAVYGKVLIDDLTVTAEENGYMAAPVIKQPTDFTETSFKANWEPVRDATDYRFFLYKKEYTQGKEDSVMSLDFEQYEDSFTAPEGWTIIQNKEPKLSINEGENNSKAIILHEGDTLITPNLNAAYKVFNAWGKAIYKDSATMEEDMTSAMFLEVYDGREWISLGMYIVSGFAYYPGFVDFYEENKMVYEDPYYAVRLTFKDFTDPDTYFVFDNINIETEAPMEFIIQRGKDGDYTTVKDTCYTPTELDPEGIYYYKVQSHNNGLTGDSGMQYAFGVAKPKTEKATDIKEGKSYTANWNGVPKATRYVAANFGTRTVKEDTKDYIIIEEKFNKANCTAIPTTPEKLENYTFETSLDKYTDTYGWTGVGNTVAEETVGCDVWEYASSYIKSPVLNLLNSDSCKLTIKAYSTFGEQLLVTLKDGESLMLPFDKPNDEDTQLSYMERTITLPCRRSDEQIKFSVFYGYPMMIDEIKVTQDVKAGDRIYDYLSETETDSSTLNTTFDGLEQFNYDEFAFTVWALLDETGKTAISGQSDFQHVKVKNDIRDAETEMDEDVEIIGYYTITGIKIPSPQKGLNIIKLSNGKTIKRVFTQEP